MRIYNTLAGKKEEFRPLRKGRVHMYVCGPTVYGDAHLGHARTNVAFDLVVRFLRFLGYDVRYVRNFTDVGHLTEETLRDKVVSKAKEMGVHPMEVAEHYINSFLKDMDALYVERPNIMPRASGHIHEIIEAVRKLEEKGYTYEIDDGVYFDLSKFKDYGKLSHQKPEKLIRHRVEPNPKKRNPADFALWRKAKKDDILYWESPWGKGYPGWHIECSVMSMKYLGETLDIHGGGADLIFPHHENEIVQSESLTGKTFSRYWMHVGLVTINGEKMAKSKGNFILVKDLLKKYDGEVLRLFLLSTHYRSPLDFNEEGVKQAEKNLRGLYNTLFALKSAGRKKDKDEEDKRFEKEIEKAREGMIEALKDDFNTPKALSQIYEFAGKVNEFLSKPRNEETLQKIKGFFEDVKRIFGILNKEPKLSGKEEELIELLMEVRKRLRKEKLYELSDWIRKKMGELGIELQDIGEETRYVIRELR